ncbi:MAG: crossover junction endodeoxyribonuclease RuvC [Candidatus Liptonbacteria bacterium]|nr:crossover junction endodeoxyribonuclease RuvC [Candidatus Liptonbacteria bacterium]
MVILGIDPGTHRAGYGVIESSRNECRYVGAGLLPARHEEAHLRLRDIKRGMDTVIGAFRPAGIAVEKLFVTRNQKTGIAVAQARGVILLAAAEHNLPIAEFGPGEIKSHLTGYGAADKSSVAKMVRIILKCPSLSVIDDVSDALAAALAAHFIKAFGRD